jgi:cobalt-zinc-cadmium efflux system outer membrane protein
MNWKWALRAGACGLPLLSGCLTHKVSVPPEWPAPVRPADLAASPTLTVPAAPAPAEPPLSSGAPAARTLEVPPGLPGADAPPIQLPPPGGDPGARDKALRGLYPDLPPAPADAGLSAGPDGHDLTLAELQDIAVHTNPRLRQASADVEDARGRAVQAGLYPDPVVGYQADQVFDLGTAGQQGGFFEQLIVTAGKLQLSRAAALVEFFTAQLAYRRAEIDLKCDVRAAYFRLVVAETALRAALALAASTEEVYRIQVAQVRGGQAAAYEPLQAYVLAVQARSAAVQARNRRDAAWRSLASVLGRPDMPATRVAGRADAPVPDFAYEAVLNRTLAAHTDVGRAQNGVLQARYELRRAEVEPIPNLQNHTYIQQDNTVRHAKNFQMGFSLGVTLPVWNKNQGNILAAKARLVRAEEQVPNVRNLLSQSVAEAFGRYASDRVQAAYYRDKVLPSQVRVYRAIHSRYQREPDKVSFNDVVVAQQTLAQALTTYLTTLDTLWSDVVEITRLTQTDELFAPADSPECGPPVEELLRPGPLTPATPE